MQIGSVFAAAVATAGLLNTAGTAAAQTDARDAIATVRNATVFIRVLAGNDLRSNDVRSQGTGFLVSPAGFIVTARHVVEMALNSGVRISVALRSRDAFPVPATISRSDCGTSEYPDVCVIRINQDNVAAANITQFPGLSCRALDPREKVIAVGYGEGPEDTVQEIEGRVTGGLGTFNLYPSDLLVNPGNSGGPILDGGGAVVGVVKGRASQTTYFTPLYEVKSHIDAANVNCDAKPRAQRETLVPFVMGGRDLIQAQGDLRERILSLAEWSDVPLHSQIRVVDPFLTEFADLLFSDASLNLQGQKDRFEKPDGQEWSKHYAQPNGMSTVYVILVKLYDDVDPLRSFAKRVSDSFLLNIDLKPAFLRYAFGKVTFEGSGATPEFMVRPGQVRPKEGWDAEAAAVLFMHAAAKWHKDKLLKKTFLAECMSLGGAATGGPRNNLRWLSSQMSTFGRNTTSHYKATKSYRCSSQTAMRFISLGAACPQVRREGTI